MIEIKRDNKKYVITFNNDDIPNSLIEKFMRKSELDAILINNRMTEEDAFNLSEEIKKEWWKNNKNWILKKIKE
jgi:hypothetical protein